MSQTSFYQRVSRLTDKHDRLALGVTYRVGPDGLITAVPQRRLLPRFPFKPLLTVLLLGWGFKAILFAGLGEAEFESRRALLLDGNAVERAVGWAMQPEPAVRTAAEVAARLRAS